MVRLGEMSRGETLDSCQGDVAGGEMQAVEDLLRLHMHLRPAGGRR